LPGKGQQGWEDLSALRRPGINSFLVTANRPAITRAQGNSWGDEGEINARREQGIGDFRWKGRQEAGYPATGLND